MKKMLFVLPLVAAVGCTSVKTVRDYGYLNDAQDKMTDCSYNPYHIDYSVDNARVTGQGRSICWFWFFASDDGRSMSAPTFTFDSGVKAAKESATYDAVDAGKCDALMGCIYTYTKTSKWLGIYKETTCQAKGFPAHVKSISLIEDRPVLVDKDKQLIRMKPWEKLEQEKKSGLKLW